MQSSFKRSDRAVREAIERCSVWPRAFRFAEHQRRFKQITEQCSAANADSLLQCEIVERPPESAKLSIMKQHSKGSDNFVDSRYSLIGLESSKGSSATIRERNTIIFACFGTRLDTLSHA